MHLRFKALVPAAGIGSRFGTKTPKQYHALGGRPLIDQTLTKLLSCPAIEQVHIGVAADDPNAKLVGKSLTSSEQARIRVHGCGGDSRAATVLALARLPEMAANWLVVHDAVRPCLDLTDIEAVLAKVNETGQAAILAEPLTQTLKEVDGEQITGTVSRENLWLAQTPQVVLAEELIEALEQADATTDEAQALELAGRPVQVVAAQHPNPKITSWADLELAARIEALE